MKLTKKEKDLMVEVLQRQIEDDKMSLDDMGFTCLETARDLIDEILTLEELLKKM